MGQLKNLSTTVRLTVANPSSENKSAFGPGIAKLCLGVREMGSLNAAAKGMRMAYSKAWRIIKDTEETLDVQLLLRDGLTAPRSPRTEIASSMPTWPSRSTSQPRPIASSRR